MVIYAGTKYKYSLFKTFNLRVDADTNFKKFEIMENIVIYVGVLELSGAINDLKYLSKVEDEHLWVKIWSNMVNHMQIILKLTKNFRITFLKKFEKIVVFKTPL